MYKVLDLFCGAGGAAMGYHQAGFEVVGVDNEPMPHYPFEFYQADALEYLTKYGCDFDAIHASPPCQKFSKMQHIHHNPQKHPDLIDPVRKILRRTTKPFIIENVPDAPLRIDLMLCGTMFGIKVPKHRIFEMNFKVEKPPLACDHRGVYDCYHGGEEARHEREKLCKLFNISWFMTRPEVRNAIPPAYTKFIGDQLMAYLEAQ